MKRLDSRKTFQTHSCRKNALTRNAALFDTRRNNFMPTKTICKEATLKLLNILAQKSYKSGKAKTRYAQV